MRDPNFYCTSFSTRMPRTLTWCRDPQLLSITKDDTSNNNNNYALMAQPQVGGSFSCSKPCVEKKLFTWGS